MQTSADCYWSYILVKKKEREYAALCAPVQPVQVKKNSSTVNQKRAGYAKCPHVQIVWTKKRKVVVQRIDMKV